MFSQGVYSYLFARSVEGAYGKLASRQRAPFIAVHRAELGGRDQTKCMQIFLRLRVSNEGQNGKLRLPLAKVAFLYPICRICLAMIFMVAFAVLKYLSGLYSKLFRLRERRSRRARRMRMTSICASATRRASSKISGVAPSPVISRARFSASAERAGSKSTDTVNPWRRAFWCGASSALRLYSHRCLTGHLHD